MSSNVGEIAGQIWNSLSSSGNKPVSLTTLAKNIDRKKEEIALGVGWLAREGKLHIENIGATIKVALTK
ncbi:MAG: hypothetical protein A2Y25_03825 [Candidatus Melainabacteria bacterium GWF2_37_15]|nr:MAG: hypothetical protein A2Y25_03825 [Candidatus Melainabacteria bacterium GWF2_37_15]